MSLSPSPSEAAATPEADDSAKQLISEALAPVSEDLETLKGKIPEFIPTETQSARAVTQHVADSGGKKIRPALFFLSAKMLGYRGEHYFPIAGVSELVHSASLLHDDVVDNSTVRRNRPTANSVWGDVTSVLVGDLIYSRASEMMAATGNMEIVKTFARAIRLMSEGELLQLENLYNGSIPEETYFRILECKTAILIGATCKSAGLLAGVDEDKVDRLERFGHSVGMAFQLIDDALDYTGIMELLGKQTLGDLVEGKVTLPVILVRERADETERATLARIFESPEGFDRDAAETVAKLVEKYETASAAVDRAHEYTKKAMSALEEFPASRERDNLENLARQLLNRFC